MWCAVIAALSWLATRTLRELDSPQTTETSPLASVTLNAPVFPNAEVFDQDAPTAPGASWLHGEAGQ